MRDIGRIKERYDFSLDSRQLGLVLFAALVVAALMFVLGMSVGRQWERRLYAGGDVSYGDRAVSARAAPEPELPAAPPVEPPETLSTAREEPASRQEKAQPVESKKEEPEVIAPEDLTFPKVLSSNNPPAVKPAVTAKRTAPKGDYTVQVGAFKDKSSAERFADKLKKKGYDSGVYAPNASGGGMYKVHIGGYASRSDAQKMADRLKSKEGLKPYVTSYR